MREKLGTLIGGIESTVGPKLPDAGEVPPPFFGRGAELAALRRALGVVRSEGGCRAVTVTGASGMGKTRLIEEFVREVRQLDDPPVRVFRSSAPRSGSQWSSFTQLLGQRFEITDAGDLDEAKASVRTQMAAVLDDRKVGDVLYLLGDLLDLEFQPSPLTKAFEEGAPETAMLKRAIFKNFLEADAAFGPMCLVFDDVHLCHDQTLSMLRFLIEHLKAPILFLCAGRPEISSRHGALPETPVHTTLHLEPLGEVDSAALIGSVLTPEGMTPMHLVEKARVVTGGNPGRIEDAGRFYRDRGTLPPPPASVDAALETRLEELSADERLILQKAAVMGNVFWFGGLIVLDRDGREPPEVWSPKEEPGLAALSDLLARLSERDYILRLPDATFPNEEEYVFRHRAERDRIAALTNPADARRWHRLLADWLDTQPETRSHEEYLELLADQRVKAGANESAAAAFLEAAGQSRAHGSPKRELGYYDKALALLEDGHSRRLTALLRACELLEQLDKPEAAFERYRETATLAFRLNRRRIWEAAHLAMSRVKEKLDAIEEAKQAEADAILVAEAKKRADLADAAAAAAAASAAQPAAPPVEAVEASAETARSGDASGSVPPPPEAAESDETQEQELVAALSAPAHVLDAMASAPSAEAAADDDRWDVPSEESPRMDATAEHAPSGETAIGDAAETPAAGTGASEPAPEEEPPSEAPPVEAAAEPAAPAPDDATPAEPAPTELAAAEAPPAETAPTEEAPANEPTDVARRDHEPAGDASDDGPAGEQPTMLSAADIEPPHDAPAPAVVVVPHAESKPVAPVDGIEHPEAAESSAVAGTETGT